MADENIDYNDNSASLGEIALMLTALAPVTGAILSAPIVGTTLISLAIFDSLFLLVTGGVSP